METEHNILDELKGKNPFKLPERYMEGLTAQIMASIPEETYSTAKVVSLRDRVRPWLYLAGVFAGLLILFRVFLSPVLRETDQSNEASSYLQALVAGEIALTISEEDLEYLEYIEDQYLDRDFVEEIDYIAH